MPRRETTRRLTRVDRGCIRVAKLAGTVSRLLGVGAGRTITGHVALRLRPQLLQELAHDRTVVLVSGTNGKSTTARLLTEAIGTDVVTNSDGANLLSGLLGVLLTDADGHKPAVLEVDELVLPAALSATQADLVVLLNLSRDQLDRMEEVSTHVPRWSTALQGAPAARVVANADDPLVVVSVLRARPEARATTWVGAGSLWHADTPCCPHCGAVWSPAVSAWQCASCGLERPRSQWELSGEGVLVGPGDDRVPLELGLPGRASAANAVMAVAAADAMGVPVLESLPRLRAIRSVDGRYERFAVTGRDVQLLLAKNPAGWLEVLTYLDSSSASLVLGINARVADGTDPSWLWDVPFDQLRGRSVTVFGDRALDLSVRLHYAGVEHQVETSLRAALTRAPGTVVQVAANYTAFVTARSDLRAAASASG